MHRLSAPFGEALLDIRTESSTGTVNVLSEMVPPLPEGMRVEECHLYAFSLDVRAGETLLVDLRLNLADGWTADFASGESLDAFEFTDGHGRIAAIGMRDPDWLIAHHRLEIIEANDPIGTLQSVARYRVLAGGSIEIQAAIAWTNQPATDQEGHSPWFAVDKAMIF